MTDSSKRAFERAMRLAVVSGLRSTFGMALMEAAYNRPNRKAWALAAMGEVVVDKLPFTPSRASLPAMIPRAVAGGYVAKQVMDREGVEDPWAVPMGAAVASGVAALAPRIRGTPQHRSGRPRAGLLGLVEDYIALKVGGDALGMSMDDLRKIGEESVEEVKGYVMSVDDRRLILNGSPERQPSVGGRGLDVTAERALGDAHPRVRPVGQDLLALQLGQFLVGRQHDRPAGVVDPPGERLGDRQGVAEHFDRASRSRTRRCAPRRSGR